jgi:hypothetical protein
MRQHARYVHDDSSQLFQADQIDQLSGEVIGISEKVGYRIRRIVEDRGYLSITIIIPDLCKLSNFSISARVAKTLILWTWNDGMME